MFRYRMTAREKLFVGIFGLAMLLIVPTVMVLIVIGVDSTVRNRLREAYERDKVTRQLNAISEMDPNLFGRSLEPAACPQVKVYLDTVAVLHDQSSMIVTVEVPPNIEVVKYSFIRYPTPPKKMFRVIEKINPNLGCHEAMLFVRAVLEGTSTVRIDLYAPGVVVYQETFNRGDLKTSTFSVEVHPHAPPPTAPLPPPPTKPIN